jgi:hypothetical protein
MKALLMIALVYGKHINSPRRLRRPNNMLGGTIHSKIMPLLEQELIHQNQVITAAMQFLKHRKYFLKGFYVKEAINNEENWLSINECTGGSVKLSPGTSELMIQE